ncbi:MAG: LamG domain-containing protein, partial [Planctomycetes bacterium]|nr:LamG domain-containing protein [Planctomycetota bacterium]
GGPEAWPNNTRNAFDVSEMTIGLDNKVTFRIHNLASGVKDFHSKEAGLDGDGIERSPLLRVAYDPNEPFFPAPYDGALQVPVTIAQLDWKLFGADKATEECEVFFGTDPSPSISIGMVSKLDLPNHMTDPNMVFDLSAELPLAQSTTYYWYVKPTYGNPSQIYSFSTTDPPVNVNPADGATGRNPGNPTHVTFEWINAADSFDIYISRIEEDVNSLNGNALVKTGIVGNEWFPEHDLIEFILSGDLDYGGVDEVYFWRVVAKSSTGSDTASEMTSFTLNNYERIENFGEADDGIPYDHYTEVTEGLEYTGRIGTWTAENATILPLNNSDEDPNNDGLLVGNNGAGGLQLNYDDSTGISTAKCVFAEPRDWSSAVNRAAMRIVMHGDPDNDLEQITVTVTDTGNVSDSIIIAKDDDDIADMMVAVPWFGFENIDIPLPTGLDLSSVKGYSISVGDASGTEKGILYIDTVTVRSVRCLTNKIPYYFNNGDCLADVNEITTLAGKWLLDLTPTTVLKGSEPATAPVLYHTFDTGTYSDGETFTGVANSNVLTRTAGDEPAGTHQSTYVPTASYPTTNTHSMLVDSTHRMQTSSFTNLPTGSATLSIWVKPDNVTDNLRTGSNYGTLYGQRPFRIDTGSNSYWRLNAFDNDGDVQMGGGGINGVSEDVDVYALEGTWFHIAYVHDYDNNSNAIYVNGLKIDENTDIEEMLPFPASPNRMRIPHNGDNNGYNGLIDEVRLYNYALTQPEVLFLADVASVDQPVDIGMAGDVNGDDAFDLADLAEVSENYQAAPVLFP